MQILLANAKIMFDEVRRNPASQPRYAETARLLAAEMSTLSIEELARQLDCSRKLAAENWQRYQEFFHATPRAALFAYNGHAYKHLKAHTLSEEAIGFGQQHLWITSFLYGLLRPLDAIVPYRMEHCVTLEATHREPVNRYWKALLTDTLIEQVKQDDGILLHLSTEEYEHLFDWKRVRQEVTVIQPLFYVRSKGGLKMQAVWAKACRGAMVRYVLQHQIADARQLQGFFYQGFAYQPLLGEMAYPHFVRDDESS